MDYFKFKKELFNFDTSDDQTLEDVVVESEGCTYDKDGKVVAVKTLQKDYKLNTLSEWEKVPVSLYRVPTGLLGELTTGEREGGRTGQLPS